MSGAVDDGCSMDPEKAAELATSARKIVRAYAGLYRRRAHKGDGTAFTNPEANALATLAMQRAASARPRDFDGDQLVVSMYSLTHALMPDGYSRAVAMIGVSWGDGYGTLPLDAPPLKILDAITTAGAAPGAVSGLYGAAWHGLFLTSAAPLLNAQTRPLAVQQLARWVDYVRPKLAAMAAEPLPDLPELSQRARIAVVVGLLAERLGDDALRDDARSLVMPWLAERSGPATLATAPLAQLAAAATATGLGQHGVSLVRALIDQRLDDDRSLLRAHDDHGEQIETSPWVPLAVLDAGTLALDAAAGSGATPARRAPAIGSRLGDALRRAARSSS